MADEPQAGSPDGTMRVFEVVASLGAEGNGRFHPSAIRFRTVLSDSSAVAAKISSAARKLSAAAGRGAPRLQQRENER
ncbi:hypothetical protein [Streptomyces sp. NPDC020983]|uniref:hypothetical protein n=1 Tax=Streptomyces sp. NPDC020983 TaxID=3365106 RepID=UPI0037A85DC2